MTIEQTAPRETSAPGITPEMTAAFLTDRLGPDVSNLKSLRLGGWSNAYAFDHDGTTHVIRFSSYRDDFEKDSFASRWATPNLPVPTVTEIGEAFGGYFASSGYVPGIALDDLDGPAFDIALPGLLAMLDGLRTADLTGTNGFGGWDSHGAAPFPAWQDYLLKVADDGPSLRNHGWRQQLADSPVGIARFDEAYRHFENLVRHLPPTRHLIHSDLLNYNLLVDGRRINGVIDWGCGLFGDFLYDIAWFVHYWPWYPAWQEIDFVEVVRHHYRDIGLHVPDLDERIRCYQIHIGLGDQAYNTYMRRWDLVENAAQRTLGVAHGKP